MFEGHLIGRYWKLKVFLSNNLYVLCDVANGVKAAVERIEYLTRYFEIMLEIVPLSSSTKVLAVPVYTEFIEFFLSTVFRNQLWEKENSWMDNCVGCVGQERPD